MGRPENEPQTSSETMNHEVDFPGLIRQIHAICGQTSSPSIAGRCGHGTFASTKTFECLVVLFLTFFRVK